MGATLGLTEQEITELTLALAGNGRDRTARQSRSKEIRQYDFGSRESLSKTHIKVLQSLFSDVERLWTNTLTRAMGTDVTISLSSLEQARFSAYVESLPTPALVTSFTTGHLTGQSLLDMPVGLAMSMVELIAGGRGGQGVAARRLSRVEQRLVRRVLIPMLSDLASAWKPLVRTQSELGNTFSSPSATDFEPDEMMVIAGFLCSTPSARYRMNVVIPAASLDAIRDLLTPENWLRGKATGLDPIPDAAPILSDLLGGTSIEAAVELGRANVSVQDVVGMEIGDVIRLDRAVSDGLDIRIEGSTKFHGRPGLVGRSLAVQITDAIGNSAFQPQTPEQAVA